MYFVSDIIVSAPVNGRATRILLTYAQTGTSIRYARSSSPHFAQKNAKGLRKLINFWIRVAPLNPHTNTTAVAGSVNDTKRNNSMSREVANRSHVQMPRNKHDVHQFLCFLGCDHFFVLGSQKVRVCNKLNFSH